jgi:hypothetical protein
MYDKNALCHKITELYPGAGTCGIDIDVDFDQAKKVWVIDLKKDNHELKHHLEVAEAEPCMAGKQCVSLGLEVAQLLRNIEGRQF